MTGIGAFREWDARELAPSLLGWTLVSRIGGEEVAGRIVETEARCLPLRFYIRGNPHVSTGPHEPAASGVA